MLLLDRIPQSRLSGKTSRTNDPIEPPRIAMSEPTPWHRLFGLSWMDFFRGMPVTVETEMDLSIKQQLLDVVIIRKNASPLPRRLPDGFEELATHNLITFKSYQEALDGWALHELIGHYVNYRKQVSPTMQELLPETDFRLFAVCVRFPQGLASDVELKAVEPGVYEVRHFTGVLRLIVVHELPKEEQNAMLHLFSARLELVQYGRNHYQLKSRESTRLLTLLFTRYVVEAALMPDTFEKLVDDAFNELLRTLPTEKRLEGLSAEERVKGLSTIELLAALTPEAQAELAQHFKATGAPPAPETNDPKPADPKP